MRNVIVRDRTLNHLGAAAVYALASILLFGIAYPLLVTLLATLLFPAAAGGSYAEARGRLAGSQIIGQRFVSSRYFQGRPSAAGKNGYDPTATGGTNLGPTSEKLIAATRVTLAALRKANPHTAFPVPMDLVTSSGSGIDPDISPEAAMYQAARVAQARGLRESVLRSLVTASIRPPTFGVLGEARVNVLALNLALDRLRP